MDMLLHPMLPMEPATLARGPLMLMLMPTPLDTLPTLHTPPTLSTTPMLLDMLLPPTALLDMLELTILARGPLMLMLMLTPLAR